MNLISCFLTQAQVTTYACQSFLLPTDIARHAIAFEMIVDTDTIDNTHHAILHVCQNNSYWDTHYNNPSKCSSDGTSESDAEETGSSPLGETTSSCASLAMAWARGGSIVHLPDEAGFRVSNDTQDISHVILEVHYDNAAMASGLVDNTILRVYLTSQLRTYDAGGMTIGDPAASLSGDGATSYSASPAAIGPIPSLTAATHYQTTCPSECTTAFSHSITVWGSFLHMHSVGHQIWTSRWDSSNNYLGQVRHDWWNEGFQSVGISNFGNYTVNPGDRLQTHCRYDTSKKSSAVNFGTGSTDEMCMDFIFYYPRLFLGQDSTGTDQLFAFCGLYMSDSVWTAMGNNAATMCGSRSVEDVTPYISGVTQLDQGIISVVNPVVDSITGNDSPDVTFGTTTSGLGTAAATEGTACTADSTVAEATEAQQITQQVTFTGLDTSSYTGDTQTLAEQAYGNVLGIYTTSAGWISGCSVTSSASSRRSAVVTFVAVADTSYATAAETAATGLTSDASPLQTALTTLNTASLSDYWSSGTAAAAATAVTYATTTVNVGDSSATWAIQSYSTVSMCLTQGLLFEYTANAHDVTLLADETAYDSCDMTSSTTVGSFTASPYTWTPSAAGTYYFACSVSGHCAAGQKVAVTVTDSCSSSSSSSSDDDSTTLYIIVAACVVGFAALLAAFWFFNQGGGSGKAEVELESQNDPEKVVPGITPQV